MLCYGTGRFGVFLGLKINRLGGIKQFSQTKFKYFQIFKAEELKNFKIRHFLLKLIKIWPKMVEIFNFSGKTAPLEKLNIENLLAF